MHKLIDGVRLAYEVAGSGETLVLLHGFPLDRTIWDASFAALAERCRVIRLDLRGSGESDRGHGPALMETLAGDVCGLLDVLGIERAIVVGHSMGGYAALAFFRMYAERVAGLGLVASHVAADTPTRAGERDAQAEAIVAHGMAPVADALVRDLFAPASLAAHPASVARVRAIVARQDPAGAAAQIIGMKERVDSADLLDDIRVPTLIVGGTADRLIAPPTLEATAAAIADCKLVLLPGAGHLPMLEAPEATTAALERLVARSAYRGPDTSRQADAHSGRATRA
jgi:3-oxoadipate enol-lactonase